MDKKYEIEQTGANTWSITEIGDGFGAIIMAILLIPVVLPFVGLDLWVCKIADKKGLKKRTIYFRIIGIVIVVFYALALLSWFFVS